MARQFPGNFHSKSEYWIGRNTYSGGDKFGPLPMTYAGTRLYTRASK